MRIARQLLDVVPTLADGSERRFLWTKFAAVYPAIDNYARFTDRELPVVVLALDD